MGLKEEWAKVNALRNCDNQLLGRRDEPANEYKRRTQTGGRKARLLWEPGNEGAARGRQWSTQ